MTDCKFKMAVVVLFVTASFYIFGGGTLLVAGSPGASPWWEFIDTPTHVERATDILIAECVDDTADRGAVSGVAPKGGKDVRVTDAVRITPYEVKVLAVIKGDRKVGKLVVGSNGLKKGRTYLLTGFGGSHEKIDLITNGELATVELPQKFDIDVFKDKMPEERVQAVFDARRAWVEARLRVADLGKDKMTALESEKTLLGKTQPKSPAAKKGGQNEKVVDPKAVEIIGKAIKSHGGAEALNKYTGGWRKCESISPRYPTHQIISETTFQYPNKSHTTTTTFVNGEKTRKVVTVFDGQKMKKTLNGTPCVIKDGQTDQLKAGFVTFGIQRLTPLLDDSRYTLKAVTDVGDEKVVEVTAKGFDGIRLFFDKKTGLLVKTSQPSGDPKEATIDTLFSDYKDVQGVKVAMKQVISCDGKAESTMTVTEAKMLEVVDPKTFNVQ